MRHYTYINKSCNKWHERINHWAEVKVVETKLSSAALVVVTQKHTLLKDAWEIRWLSYLRRGRGKQHPKTNPARQSVELMRGSDQSGGVCVCVCLSSDTYRPCVFAHGPWCRTSSHRSRRRTSSRRSRGRSCCARVGTTASWRPCRTLHTDDRKTGENIFVCQMWRNTAAVPSSTWTKEKEEQTETVDKSSKRSSNPQQESGWSGQSGDGETSEFIIIVGRVVDQRSNITTCKIRAVDLINTGHISCISWQLVCNTQLAVVRSVIWQENHWMYSIMKYRTSDKYCNYFRFDFSCFQFTINVKMKPGNLSHFINRLKLLIILLTSE